MDKEKKYIGVGNCGVNIVEQLPVDNGNMIFINGYDFPYDDLGLLTAQDKAIVVCGLGGRHGVEVLPRVVEKLYELGIETVGVFTTPARFEGKVRNDVARESMMRVQMILDVMVVVSNNSIAPDMEICKGLKMMDERVWEIIKNL